MPEQKKINPVPDLYSDEQWEQLCLEDPSYRVFEGIVGSLNLQPSAASPWQTTLAQTHFEKSSLEETLPDDKDAKGGHPAFRDVQKKCWEKYRTFPPINASINSKADYTVGKGFEVSSEDPIINDFLQDLFYSYRNRLYARIPGWEIRMHGEGELFILLSFEELEGKASLRVLEPERIGEDDDTGLILHPEDASQTLFYKHKSSRGVELIPDIAIAFDPELVKLVKQNLDPEQLAKSKGGKAYSEVGGFKRFVIHRKNLTGIQEYERDTSHLVTILEAVNLYWNAIKWQLDHKKAQASYTNIFKFEDTPAGKIAWHIWKAMTTEQKEATGLTKPLTPGSRIFLMPGISYDVKSPQLQKLEGENLDLLNLAGAGARTPQDLWQGQSSGSTFASLKQSRSPLEMEIENLQHKNANFLKWELLRVCFHVASKVGQFPETFKKMRVTAWKNGTPATEEIDVEPAKLVNISYPHIVFDDQLYQKVAAYLGSKHAGLAGRGLSDEDILKKFGIDNIAEQKAKQAIEKLKYGEPQQPVQ